MAYDNLHSPVDYDADDEWARDEPARGPAFGIIAVATAFLALTNAVSIRDWVDEQPPSARQAAMTAWSDAWLARTEAIGLATPRAALHAQWEKAKALRLRGGDG